MQGRYAMSEFTISSMPDAAILNLVDMEQSIEISPDYQRPGGVWSLAKKQLFIDSLINGYDIPKFYFHILSPGSTKKYAIIDGRQRLETIWQYARDDFALAPDFKFFHNEEIAVGGLKCSELAQKYPRLYTKFNARTLAITLIATSDMDVIEDMFSRLNEAAPLNAAEKRNAYGGPLPGIVRELVKRDFFQNRVKINSSRFRHNDMATKMLYLESSDNIVDTKKVSLDIFAKSCKNGSIDIKSVQERTEVILACMEDVFIQNDVFLKSSANVILYYVLFSKLIRENKNIPRRDYFVWFEELREKNRLILQNTQTDDEDKKVDYKLIEYDELAQSSNDAGAIFTRYTILRQHLGV